MKLEPVKIHIFPFSSRPGTKAAAMAHRVPSEIVTARRKLLENKTSDVIRDKLGRQIGKEYQVLFEQRKGGFWQGYSQNYIAVRIKSGRSLRNCIETVSITGVDKEVEVLLATTSSGVP